MALLTEAKARNIKPTDKAISHGGVPGLRLIPSKAKGHGRWELRFVSPLTGKRRDAGLGSYPTIGIAAAREKAEAMRLLISQGIDPIEQAKEAAKLAAPIKHTFQSAALAALPDLQTRWKAESSTVRWMGRMTNHIFPMIGDVKIEMLTVDHVAAVLRPIWTRQPETASKVKHDIGLVLRWCKARKLVEDIVSTDVADVLGKALERKPTHQPMMPHEHIPNFVKDCLLGNASVSKNLMLFTILTAVRSANAREAVWTEFDFTTGVWSIPASKMKTDKPLRLPISSGVMDILIQQQGLHPELVFPSPRGLVLSDMAMTSLLRKTNAISDVEGRSATAHGFRSAFKIWAVEEGYLDELSEIALGHSIGTKITRAYRRTDQLEQRRVMMQAWSDYVLGKI
ncbi:tyrosine-type recombinase/integrase [Chitinibacter sp. SCUT-21]|uniref:tyrosine-type recombinase/integrase n=1 Tax=Chitinibacter sp. SCUT-21 TaxID=2970891 RepID=UPI0035A6D811